MSGNAAAPRLRAGPDQNDAATGDVGGRRRVGLAGVLADLDRRTTPAYAPGRLVGWAFGWDPDDSRDRRWWPQGVTTNADAYDAADDGPDGAATVLLTSAYAKDGPARISVVDLSDPDRIGYRHVALVRRTRSGLVPVRAHAGGLVWRGRHLYVAATARGVHTFDLADLAEDGAGGYHLPLRRTHAAIGPTARGPGSPEFRYSFLSLARGHPGPSMLVGEYGRGAMTRRLARFALTDDGSLRTDRDGACTGTLLPDGVPGMQGAVLNGEQLHVATSNGPARRSDLWTGAPGRLLRRRGALPVGVEDLSLDPYGGHLWSVTEHPGMRWVVRCATADL